MRFLKRYATSRIVVGLWLFCEVLMTVSLHAQTSNANLASIVVRSGALCSGCGVAHAGVVERRLYDPDDLIIIQANGPLMLAGEVSYSGFLAGNTDYGAFKTAGAAEWESPAFRADVVFFAKQAINKEYTYTALYAYGGDAFGVLPSANTPSGLVPNYFRCDGLAEWSVEQALAFSRNTAPAAYLGFYTVNSPTHNPVDITSLGVDDTAFPLRIDSGSPSSGVPITVSKVDSMNLLSGTTGTGGSTLRFLYSRAATVTITAPLTAPNGNVFSDWWGCTAQGGTKNLAARTCTTSMDYSKWFTAAYVPPSPVTHTVIVSASPSSYGTASGGGTFADGSSCTVTATAYSGYSFVSWTENGSPVSSSANYSFTVNASRTLVANFRAGAAGGTCGSPIVISSFPYNDNNTTFGKASSMNGYSIPPATGSEAGPEVVYQFSVPTSGSLTVTVTDGAGVDIDPHLLSSCSPSYCLARADSTFTYALQAGTYFIVCDTWTNTSGTQFPGAYTMTATFTPSTCYTLSTVTSPQNVGGVGVSTGQNCSGGYLPNTAITLTANTPSGYTFSQWSGSSGGFSSLTANPTTFTITGNASVTAIFTPVCYSLGTSTSPGGVGGITLNTGQNCSSGFIGNTAISLTANTPDGYTFSGWSSNGGSFSSLTSNPTSFTITGNENVMASFTQSASTCTSFTVSPPSASASYVTGFQNVTLVGSPSGCQGGSWSTAGNGSWLTVSPVGGNGPGPVTVTWTQNPNQVARSDNATIAGNSFPVSQGAAPGGPIQSYVFTHLAGNDIGAGYIDGTGSAARFSYPYGVAIDTAGNAYVADTRNSTIRKITPTGDVTTLAGLAGNRGSADGTGGAAGFTWPSGVATDGGGNVYVADAGNNTIRKITSAAMVTTLAGVAGSSGSADGTGNGARFGSPMGVATDSAGNVYVADTSNNTIRKITPAGVVTTLAGQAGSIGSADGTGSAARFNQPGAVATDGAGNVYVADQNNYTIRKITPAGVVTTLAGLAGSNGYGDGTGSAARFWFPHGVATDGVGNVYVADTENETIRKITPAGVVTTLAGQPLIIGSEDGTGSAAHFFFPWGVATDTAGNVYVMDAYNNTLRKITPGGVVTSVAGLAGNKYGSADGTGSAARFNGPFGVATDNGGNVYVADSNNATIRKITPSGAVSTFAGSAGQRGSADGTGSGARFWYVYGVATDSGGNVYVGDSSNNTIRKITPGGVVTTLAGLAGSTGSTDGTGSAALFNYPYGVATDAGSNIYVADTFNHTIRKVTPAGVVTTLAGLAGSSGSADGTGSAARFNSPFGVATDSSGNVYVADSINDTIRKIAPSGAVTTLAGLAGAYGNTDGTGSDARFFFPSGLVTDSAGNLYVADSSNNTIRKITPAGVVTTLAGIALSWGSTDGIADAVRFDGPSGIAIDTSGNLYVGDQNNQAIRVGRRAISDVAQIDSATGTAGAIRQLDVAPQTATSWQWSVIRRPSGSTAQLSSTTLRNPTFTPDVADLYQFQLIASSSSGTSITLVSLLASSATLPPTPTGVTAIAMTSTRVDVTWNAVVGATYQIDRQAAGGVFSQIGTPATNSFSDTTASADSAYLYRVRAVNGSGQSPNSGSDLATTVIFVDDPLEAGTLVKAVHLSQLRTAVNAVRLLAGLPLGSFTGEATSGTVIEAIHITELRASLDAARGTLGLSTGGYTDASLTGVAIKALHWQELRDRVK